MKGRIFFLLVIGICFLGSMVVADWVKAGMNVNASSNLGNATGSSSLKSAFHSTSRVASSVHSVYSLRARAFKGENVQIMNTFSKNASTGVMNTGTDIQFSSNSAGSLDVEEKIGVGSSEETGDEVECFDAAVGIGLDDNTEAEFHSTGTTTTDTPMVNCVMSGKGRGGMRAGAEGRYLKYVKPSVEPVEDTRYGYHLRTYDGYYDFTGNYTMGVE
ncbi:MAG: hypothetical protein KAW82_00085 [Desulfurellaceae bacterium]|nr:hypothetical protein [Desulfurellaceae bacterium]